MEQLFRDNIFSRQQKEQQLLYSNKERKQSRNKHEHKSNNSITSSCNFRLISFVQAGRWDVYIYSPCGVKFASRKKLKGFFEKNNLNYDPEDFDFTPYGRHIDSRAAIAGVAGGGGGGGAGGGGTGGGGAAAAAAAAAGGSASNAASRHNSSGSTGSDGTQPGSSPASIANYSPTHVHASPYLPQSSFMSMGHAHHAVSAAAAASLVPPPPVPPGGSAMMGAPPSFADYSTVGGGGLGGGGGFAPFDPHMENPPNASALDVPGSFSSVSTASSSSSSFATSQQDLLTSSSSSSLATATSSSSSSSVYSNHLTLPYHHLGRGHHHPIVKGEHQGAGSEFIPAADMVDILGSGSNSSATAVAASGADHSSLHNGGLVGFPSFASASSTSAAALQPLSNASSAHSRTSEEEDSKSGVLRDVKSEQQQQQRSSSANSAILGAQGSSSSPSSAAGGGGGGGGGSDPSGAGGDRGGFSLGRTMSVLQSQEGFEEYNFY